MSQPFPVAFLTLAAWWLVLGVPQPFGGTPSMIPALSPLAQSTQGVPGVMGMELLFTWVVRGQGAGSQLLFTSR